MDYIWLDLVEYKKYRGDKNVNVAGALNQIRASPKFLPVRIEVNLRQLLYQEENQTRRQFVSMGNYVPPTAWMELNCCQLMPMMQQQWQKNIQIWKTAQINQTKMEVGSMCPVMMMTSMIATMRLARKGLSST